MTLTDDEIIDSIEVSEGWPKYTDHPDDKGGPTKGGITLATLEHWRQRPCDKEDLKQLDRHEARQIYQKMFIDDPGFRCHRNAPSNHKSFICCDIRWLTAVCCTVRCAQPGGCRRPSTQNRRLPIWVIG